MSELAKLMIAGFFFTSPLLAKNPFHLPEKFFAAKKMQKTGDQLDCANFDGRWEGACTNKEGERDTQVWEFKQYSCEEITIEGDDDLPIGGTASETKTSPARNSVESTLAYPQWNSGRTGLVIRVQFSERELGTPEYLDFSGSMRMSMVNGQVIVKQDYVITQEGNNSKSVYNGWMECTLDKK